MVGSSRSDRPAASRRALASLSRAACVSSALPADSCALRFIAPATIFGRPALLMFLAAVPARRAARSRACCISRFSRFTSCAALRILLCAASPLCLHCSSVRGEIPAVVSDLAGIEFGDAVRQVQQLAVVAHQQQTADPILEDRIQLPTGGQVEVVGRFVEQQHIGTAEQLSRQSERDNLSATESGQPPVQADAIETEPVQLGQGPLLDVPVGADRGEHRVACVVLLPARREP